MRLSRKHGNIDDTVCREKFEIIDEIRDPLEIALGS